MRGYQGILTWAAAGGFAAIVAAGAAMFLVGSRSSTESSAQVAVANQLKKGSQEPRNVPIAAARRETIVYDSWTVTCQESASNNSNRACIASLRVNGSKQGEPLLNWQIGYDPQNRYVTAVHVVPGLTTKDGEKVIGGAILVANGLELKLGNGSVRRLNYSSCGAQDCLAEATIDDGFIREALASTKATVLVHTIGGDIPIDVPIKGIDKALSSTRP